MREVSVRTEYTQENMLKFFKFNLFSRNKAVCNWFYRSLRRVVCIQYL